MRKVILFLLFALCLSLFSIGVHSEPNYENYGFNFTNETKYSSNSVFLFNSNWTNTTGAEIVVYDSNTNFTLGRPDGTISVYNLSTSPALTNNTTALPAMLQIIFTQIQIGPVGIYNYSFGLKTANVSNVSQTWTNTTPLIVFNISKADNPLNLYLNNSTNQNKIYTYPEAINATTISAGGTVYLYRNSSHIVNGTLPQSELILLGNGTYEYKINATGNANYSDNSSNVVYYAFVNKGIPLVTLYINGDNSNKIVNLNETLNLTAVSNASELNVTLNLNSTEYLNNFQNGTSPQTNLTNTSLLGMGVFNFSAQAIGNANYSNSSLSSLYFYVANLSTSPSSSVNYTRNASYNFSIKLPVNISSVIFEANFNGTFVNYTTNFINVTNWNKSIDVNGTNGDYWINFTDLMSSTHYYRWIVNDTNSANFSTSNFTYVINKFQVIPSFSSSVGWSTTTSTPVTLTCSNLSYPVSLAISGASCSPGPTGNPSNPANCTFTTPSSSGSTTYICYVYNDTNYLSPATGNLSYTTTEIITPTPPPTGSFTLTPSSSSITLEPNSSGTITLTLKNTYSYNFTKINITVSGIDTSWYSLSKVNISVLQKNGTDTSILTLNIPGDAERKNYTIIASAVGRDPSGYRLTRQASIKLIIPELPQNVTNVTNETESSNNTGIGNQTNQTNVTGFSINLEEFKDYIVLLIALVSIVLIFIFRNEFTGFIRGKRPEVHPEHKTHEEPIHKEPKKIHRILSHVKKKISSLSEHKLVIQVKKKEKEEKA
jgi:hypothetical protein